MGPIGINEILARSGGAHVVRFAGMKSTTYVLFEPLTRPLAKLLSADRPCLLWVRDLGDGTLTESCAISSIIVAIFFIDPRMAPA